MSERPTGTITFFTDIEGSTRLWEQHPEVMEAALTRQDSLAGDSPDAGPWKPPSTPVPTRRSSVR